MADFFSKGVQLLNIAVALDKSHNYKEALKMYIRALEHFITGLKCTFPSAPHVQN